MKALPEKLHAISRRYQKALKPVLIFFVLMIVLLAVFGNTDVEAPANARILTLVLAYGCVQSFFFLAVLYGYSQLKSQEYQGLGWRYFLARMGEWVNGCLIVICNLLPLPVLIFLINRVMATS